MNESSDLQDEQPRVIGASDWIGRTTSLNQRLVYRHLRPIQFPREPNQLQQAGDKYFPAGSKRHYWKRRMGTLPGQKLHWSLCCSGQECAGSALL